MTAQPTIRDLGPRDAAAAAKLHEQVLHMEFLARCGQPFLRHYYAAWAASPGGIAIVAIDDNDNLLGLLLGATDPATHTRSIVRRDGMGLALRLLAHSLRHPRLARELVATRAIRYLGGVWRMAVARIRPAMTRAPERSNDGGDDARIGEVTHLLVDPGHQGGGVGRALVDAAVGRAQKAGVTRVDLVTPPDLAARHFYERLGWQAGDEIASRSGEAFVRYSYDVNAR